MYADLWTQLIADGLLSTEPPVRLDGGNDNRDAAQARSSWRAALANGTETKLTVAEDLSEYFRCSRGLHDVCPSVSPQPFYLQRCGALQVVAEEFISGVSLSSLLTGPNNADEAIASSLHRIIESLDATAQPSNREARDAEWNAWTAAVLGNGYWTIAQRRFLSDQVLPTLDAAALFSGEPTQRWIHGDLIGRNILVNQANEAHLIDAEFAGLTHFPAVESASFYLLTPRADRLAKLLPASFQPPDTAGQIFFWIRQLQREIAVNRADYLERWIPTRIGEIRRLNDHLRAPSAFDAIASERAGAPDDRGSRLIDHHIEVAHWLIESPDFAMRISGWCHAISGEEAISSVVAESGGNEVAAVPTTTRPDVQAHFEGSSRALQTGFELWIPPIDPNEIVSLVALLSTGQRHRFWSSQAGALPGRGPIICDYPTWAELMDPDPTPLTTPESITFSVLLPVYNTPTGPLRECLDSIRNQHYKNWELRVVDDASTESTVQAILREYAALDTRIRVVARPSNGGIAIATNDALAAATGQFVVFVDHDDVLRPHALAEIAGALMANSDLDAVYSDEDKIDETGRRVAPLLKPGISPEFLRGVMYVGHALCVRTSIAREMGGLDPAFDGVQDYEFVLRLSERTTRIRHLPKILYHWRQSAGSSALHGNVKGDMDSKQAAAVQAHLDRIGQRRRACPLGGHRVEIHGDPQLDATVFSEIRYASFENPVAALVEGAKKYPSEILILVRTDGPTLTERMRDEVVVLASLADSGCVSPVLVSREHQVLESGRTVAGGRTMPVMSGFDIGGDGFHGSLLCNREVALVSPWWVAVRRKALLGYGGPGKSWVEFSETLRAQGLFHRVCARVHAVLPFRPVNFPDLASDCPPEVSDPFYNRHFRNAPADYRLAHDPSGLRPGVSPIVFRLEAKPSEVSADGRLLIRGWAFDCRQLLLQARITIAGIDWTVGVTDARPDVVAAYPGFSKRGCGFSIRLCVPAGRHCLKLEIFSSEGDRVTALEQIVQVRSGVLWRRWLKSSAESRMIFQLLAAPSYGPRAITMESYPRPGAGRRTFPRLAIVTPSYQHARYLPETLDGVLNQSIRSDYVVQDGGSSDGSAELIRQRASELQAWSSAADQGQADAIAKGFARLSGEPGDVMGWINSDDFYLPGALEYVTGFFAEHPDVDVIFGHRVVVDENSHEVGRWFLPPHDDEILRLNDFVPQETLFWRRRIWDKVGGIDPSFKFAMDWDLLLRFQAAGAKIVRVPYFLACFRIHSAQKTSAQMESVGQKEIDALRLRTFGRVLSPREIETNPHLLRYLRKSAWIEMLWRWFRIRHP
jgi:glycosyltransferase involved in cell wall biosynthesis